MGAGWSIEELLLRGSMVITVVSLVFGLVFFRLFTPFPTLEETKAREDDLFTITLSLIITVWLGKILTKFILFIKNPQAVLAYPADKYVLYTALLMTGIYIVWQFKRKGDSRPWPDVLLSGLMVIIMGQFLYGFLSMILALQPSKVIYLGFYAVLLVGLVLFRMKIPRVYLAFSLLSTWALVHFVLGFFWTGSLFQFYVGPVFWGIVLIIGVIGMTFEKRRSISH